MSPGEFNDTLTDLVFKNVREGREFYVMRAGSVVVGSVLVEGPGYHRNAEFQWFPEASPRNKLECAVRVLLEIKKGHLLMFTVGEGRDMVFLGHLCKYGVMRRVGTVRRYLEDGSDAGLFQTKSNG